MIKNYFALFKITSSNYIIEKGIPTRIQISLWVGFVALTIFLSLIDYDSFQIGVYNDDANYAILAKTILNSNQYGIELPGSYEYFSQFPFGYPLLISPLTIIFPDNLEILKILSLIATIVNSSILFWGWQRLSHTNSYWVGLAVVGLYSVFPLVISQTRMVMSEPVFLTIYLLALLLTEQASRKEEKWWWPIIMGLIITFLVFTRTIGIIFGASIFIYLLVIRGFRFWKKFLLVFASIILTLFLILTTTSVNMNNLIPTKYFRDDNNVLIREFVTNYLPFLLTNTSQQDLLKIEEIINPLHGGDFEQESGFDSSEHFFYSIKQHFGVDVRMIVLPFGGTRDGPLIDGITLQGALNFTGFVVTGLILFGFILLLIQRKSSIFVFSSIIYLFALMFWTWDNPRLLYPIQPQLEFGFLYGISGVFAWITSYKFFSGLQQRKNLFVTIITICLISIAIIKCLNIENSRLHIGDLLARTNWAKVNTTNNAVIMTEYPLIDFIYSNRKVVPYPEMGQDASILNFETYLTSNDINYIIVAPEVAWKLVYEPTYSQWTNDLLPIINELTNENKLTMVYESGTEKIKIFKR